MNDNRNAPCCEEIAAACCYLNPFVIVAALPWSCLAEGVSAFQRGEVLYLQ